MDFGAQRMALLSGAAACKAHENSSSDARWRRTQANGHS
jgi:hypothetical protein